MSSRARLSLLSALTLAGALAAPPALAQPVKPAPPAPAKVAPPKVAPPKTDAWTDSPAKEADPPVLPAPTPTPSADEPPISASGADLLPAQPGQQAALGLAAADRDAEAKQDAKLRELEARVAADERRMRRLEDRLRILRHFKLGAFVQPQLLLQSFDAASSPNAVGGSLPAGIGSNDVIAKSDGTTTNGNYFRLRRTRLRTTFEADPARVYVELDPFPVGGVGSGVGTIVRDAEATGIARWGRDIRTEFTAGLFMLPVRLELLERSDVRPFIERSWVVQNVFPLERDIGVHARTVTLDEQLVVDVGIVNGQRLGQPHFVEEPDLDKNKDLLAHLRYRLGILTVGVSGYLGRGETVDTQNLRFKQFSRWWVNYEASAHYRFSRTLGQTRLVAELAIAQNMDTGINYAFAVPRIPSNIHDDVGNLDERALYVRLEQEITHWALVGYRYDFYSPDTAIKNNARDTHAVVTVLRFSPNLRLMNELDWAIDNVHPSGADAPSRHILTFSSVLQAGF